jgi:hypothetical protein
VERMGYMWVYLSVKGREVVAAIGCFARIKSMLAERIIPSDQPTSDSSR